MFLRVERSMLPGEDQPRLEARESEGVGEGRELDRLGTGPDDEHDLIEQPSP